MVAILNVPLPEILRLQRPRQPQLESVPKGEGGTGGADSERAATA